MSRSMIVLMVAGVGVVAAVVYLPTLSAGFVYDDISQIVIDDYIHKPANLPEVISFRVLKRDVIDRNRPVMLLSLMLDSLLWGRKPVGYHLTNMLLHASSSILLFLFLLGIFRRMADWQDRPVRPYLGALFGAMLFAVHPANTEAVCVPSFREDILVTFFTLAALILAERFPAQRKLTTVLLGAACAFLALAAVAGKESGAVAPALLLVYWLVIRRGAQPRAWIPLIVMALAVVAAFVAARFAYEPEHSAVFVTRPERLGGSFSAMLKIQPAIWAYQLGLLFRPGLLCADDTNYTIRHLSLGTALLILATAFVVTFIVARKNRAVGLGAAFYWLAILPVSNLLPMYRPMADRYMYFPMAGFCLAAGAVVCRLKTPSKKWAKVLLIVCTVAGFAVLGALTLNRTLIWHDELSLWQTTARENPYSFTTYNNLGLAWYKRGRFEEAVQAFKRSTELSPANSGECWAGLAISYDALQKPALAEEALRQAVAHEPMYAEPARVAGALIWEPQLLEKLQAIVNRISKRQ